MHNSDWNPFPMNCCVCGGKRSRVRDLTPEQATLAAEGFAVFGKMPEVWWCSTCQETSFAVIEVGYV